MDRPALIGSLAFGVAQHAKFELVINVMAATASNRRARRQHDYISPSACRLA
jgi:hypothetical protein